MKYKIGPRRDIQKFHMYRRISLCVQKMLAGAAQKDTQAEF